MKKLGMVVLVVLLLAGVVVSLDFMGSHLAGSRARLIRVGDSKQQVEYVLGHPVDIFYPPAVAPTNWIAMALSVQSETWAYGSRLDLRHPFESEFPYFFPFRLRWFHPGKDDVAIEFDSASKVSKITMPTNAP